MKGWGFNMHTRIQMKTILEIRGYYVLFGGCIITGMI